MEILPGSDSSTTTPAYYRGTVLLQDSTSLNYNIIRESHTIVPGTGTYYSTSPGVVV